MRREESKSEECKERRRGKKGETLGKIEEKKGESEEKREEY